MEFGKGKIGRNADRDRDGHTENEKGAKEMGNECECTNELKK